MKKKKLIACIATIAMVGSLFVGCGNAAGPNGEKKGEPKQEQKSSIKVGLATDEGGLNDKSFNQSADKGLKKAKQELGAEYKPIESKGKESYVQNLQLLSQDFGADLTFGVGYQMKKALNDVAKGAKDKNFAIIDEKINLPNVQSLLFKEQEGSFLVGVIAAKMTKTNKIGFIGGKEGDVIGRFEAGYVAGAKSINPNIKFDIRYADSFADSNKGYELAKSEYNAGCDIVMHAAGGVGIGLFQATSELKKAGKNVWAIGVDMDQALSLLDDKGKPQYADVILTSMVKKVDVAVFQAVQAVKDGKFKGGIVKNLGLKENGVEIAQSSRGNVPDDMKKYVKGNVPKDIVELSDKYAEAIKSGKIVVPATPKEAKAFKGSPLK
ncbi:BMP family ABC transporter substrate-binding protein [Clostridium botulinum]|uniref:Lipoprotein n=1 Tax=Clostridium botulinum C/D str. DC5 TaxID=1443128 RepID=A0A0A0IF22_CLOBO|nr:BMP family ABC transporter substrate-binding protein [Clostridium botulinum]KGM98881.1 lipoprotein [Clostridium botulinum C/D str. DC5]MCD3233844.1 BMP family ABC transporter substrate-binding protein [Clostridium botulinum D/C]MCD3239605.1 BMP family ABC transporter substrate-binding protein [Clostridium botulinum D/C]MCD3267193.1 BMP family ABC transporter substrate-binding protein [Clostridium botulinum D/C]MCD3299750.1 BMP family ABC transporter substrate-binding protein [Clostridium bo